MLRHLENSNYDTISDAYPILQKIVCSKRSKKLTNLLANISIKGIKFPPMLDSYCANKIVDLEIDNHQLFEKLFQFHLKYDEKVRN